MPTIDAETTKKTLVLFTKALRQMEREMLTYVAVSNALKVRFGLDNAEMDQMIEEARGHDAIKQQLQEKYDAPLERMLAAIGEADLQKQLLSLLARVGSTGLPN